MSVVVQIWGRRADQIFDTCQFPSLGLPDVEVLAQDLSSQAPIIVSLVVEFEEGF